MASKSKNLEAIARIIDPKAWDFYDFVVAQPQETAGQELLVRESLIKARAIVALQKSEVKSHNPSNVEAGNLFGPNS